MLQMYFLNNSKYFDLSVFLDKYYDYKKNKMFLIVKKFGKNHYD